jgi:hypothetical protein
MTENRKMKKNGKHHPSFRVLILISLTVIAIQIVGGILIYYSIDNWGDRSSFGDMFGAIGTLFSGLAFASVIYTILLQREELSRTAEAQAESERSLAEQAKALRETAKLNALSFFPAINCKIRDDSSNATFVIQNPSNIPAFDVDIWAVGAYSEEELDLSTFLTKYVSKKEHRDSPSLLTPTDEGFYGVFEHLFYPIFPQKQQNSSQLGFPLKPNGVYALVQFRDIKGTNYQQMYWFFYEASQSSRTPGNYRLGSLDPVVPVEAKRMQFDSKLKFETKKSIPDYLLEFSIFWNASISTGLLKQTKYVNVEDRGKWETI